MVEELETAIGKRIFEAALKLISILITNFSFSLMHLSFFFF